MASSMSSSSSTNKDVPEVAEQLAKITAPYGSWKSPITAEVVTGASKRLGGTAVDGNGRLIWLESRPTESGYRYRFLPTIAIKMNKSKFAGCFLVRI